MNEALSQSFLLVIVIMSALVIWEFYKSKDGQLRILIISLFVAKIFVYGGAFICYALVDLAMINPVNPLFLRLILNAPMCFIMVKLWQYIRLHNK